MLQHLKDVTCKKCGDLISTRFPTARSNKLCGGTSCQVKDAQDYQDSPSLDAPWWADR